MNNYGRMHSWLTLVALQVRVLRDGHEQAIAARELVPGDLLLLAAGDAVGADARLIEEAQLQVAEAALTGESVLVSRSVTALPDATGLADRRNMVFSGTYITAGPARAVVVSRAQTHAHDAHEVHCIGPAFTCIDRLHSVCQITSRPEDSQRSYCAA